MVDTGLDTLFRVGEAVAPYAPYLAAVFAVYFAQRTVRDPSIWMRTAAGLGFLACEAILAYEFVTPSRYLLWAVFTLILAFFFTLALALVGGSGGDEAEAPARL